MRRLLRVASLALLLISSGWPGESRQHRVEPGQTLASIARQYGISLAAVLSANPEIDPHHLRVGVLVNVPAVESPVEPITTPKEPAAGGGSWEAVILEDGRRGWVPRDALWMPSAYPLPPEGILEVATRFRGIPYCWGGVSPNGVDCSGFVQEVFRLSGHRLPRLADEQFAACQEVSEPVAGDLVFFSTYLPGPSHVGIYLGEGRFLHASSSRGVVEERIDSDYFKSRYLGTRRLPAPSPSASLTR